METRFEPKKFEDIVSPVIFSPPKELQAVLDILEFMNLVDEKRKWKLPNRQKLVEVVEQHPEVVLYAGRQRLFGDDSEHRYYFTNEFDSGNCSIPSSMVMYDADERCFKSCQYNFRNYNAVIIGENRNLKQKAAEPSSSEARR